MSWNQNDKIQSVTRPKLTTFEPFNLSTNKNKPERQRESIKQFDHAIQQTKRSTLRQQKLVNFLYFNPNNLFKDTNTL